MKKKGAFNQGRFMPKNVDKYAGDYENIYYRSSWECGLFNWLDLNPNVLKWSSEETVVPYICVTDGKPHRYFIDVKVTFSNGDTYLIELKPKYQTVPPVRGKKKQKTYITEVLAYGKNTSKWKAAQEWAKDRNYKFVIWTEDTLAKLRIKVVNK